VSELLGGAVRQEVEFSAYLFFKYADSEPETAAITPQEVLDPEAMVEEAREFVDEHGFEVLKLKGGVLHPDEEIRTLELLAEAGVASEVYDTDRENAPQGLVEVAEELEADLVCIGGRHRSPAGKLQLKTGAQEILLRAPVPVLVAGDVESREPRT
jgi:nucleotide-binding universal stress UspA family protein